MGSVSRPIQLVFALDTLRDWNNPRYHARVLRHCELCGNPFWVPPSRLRETCRSGVYCSRPCAYIGQAAGRVPWMKGLSTDDPRVAMAVAKLNAHRNEQRGEQHPMYGKRHSQETRVRIGVARGGRPAPPKVRENLEKGQTWAKGKTKDTDPRLAKRGERVGNALRGRKRPDLAASNRRRFEENPESHPNRILAKRGHETGIERAMRMALTDAGLSFERQYHIKRFYVDFAFPASLLAIEVDGAYWHDAAKDAARDAEILAEGWRVMRFTEARVTSDAAACVADVAAALRERG